MAISPKRDALLSTRKRRALHRTGEHGPEASGVAGRWPGWFEWLVLLAFTAVSCWVILVNLHYATHGRVWTGIDGEFPTDQMQFLAWIKDASHHVLSSDLFVLRPTGHVYLQPMFALSGGLVALGVPPWAALLAWKPVAILAVFFAIWAWCRRLLAGRWEVRAALVLALFGVGGGALGDEWLPFMTWGYPHAVLAVAALIAALLAYDGARREQRLSVIAPLAGFLASWVHPWQGEVLVVILAIAELARLKESLRVGLVRSLRLAVLTVGATAVPLVYYALLGRIDLAWRLGQNALLQSWSFGHILLPLIPLVVLAAPVYLRRPRGFLQTAAMAWPVAALLVYGLNEAGFAGAPQHAWVGIAVPLAVLAVQAARSVWLPLLRRVPVPRGDRSRRVLEGVLVTLAVAALTIPGTAITMKSVPPLLKPSTDNQNLLTTSEQRALHFLANDPEPGGVLTSPYLGDAVPGETGRRVYSSDDWRWSQPHPFARATAARQLIYGKLSPAAAQKFVLSTGARFVLVNCRSHTNLEPALRPIISSVHRFGCASLYRIS